MLISPQIRPITLPPYSPTRRSSDLVYSLFIVALFLNELIFSSGLNDLSPKELAVQLRTMSVDKRAHAMGMALGTAGGSVVFAGATVLIALAALSDRKSVV